MMKTETIRHGDLRNEQMGSPALFPTTRPEVPSPNLKKIMDALGEPGELAKLKLLAERIERGDATCSEEESLAVYDGFVLLMDYVIDLTDMCRRREEALAEQGVRIGR